MYCLRDRIGVLWLGFRPKQHTESERRICQHITFSIFTVFYILPTELICVFVRKSHIREANKICVICEISGRLSPTDLANNAD
jgi:hypothetical protein